MACNRDRHTSAGGFCAAKKSKGVEAGDAHSWLDESRRRDRSQSPPARKVAAVRSCLSAHCSSAMKEHRLHLISADPGTRRLQRWLQATRVVNPPGRVRREFIPWIVFGFFALAAFVSHTGSVFAQASVPPRGLGSVSFSYQKINHTGHIYTDGSTDDGGRSVNHNLYIEGEYGITDRFAVSLGLPFVFSKFTDNRPLPPNFPFPLLPSDECHCWKSGFQDFNFIARYNTFGYPHSALAVTPFVSIGVPSHSYEFRGEAVLGRDLRELRFGMDATLRIDAISENLYLQGQYSYAFVERVLNIRNDRSNVRIEGDYLFARKKMTLSGLVTGQRTHGGLSVGSNPVADPGEFNTSDRKNQRDRLLRDNNWRAGIGASYSFQRMDVRADFTKVIGGSDTHILGAVTFGVSFPFELRRRHESPQAVGIKPK
jgi:hypothetical protein